MLSISKSGLNQCQGPFMLLMEPWMWSARGTGESMAVLAVTASSQLLVNDSYLCFKFCKPLHDPSGLRRAGVM